ncbi:MAG: lipoate--protein ligase family protein [Hadesarchaea archaeon]|nr:lipoate--protein ligase family protein [Hadesarchaea archaeon]
MRLLWLHPHRTVEALAVEEAVLRSRLENSSPNTLCFWRGKRCLVLGYNPNHDRVNFMLCKELGIPICRRNSGGGAIYQDEGNLNYSLIAAQDGLSLPQELKRASWIIDSIIAEALSDFGVRARPMEGGGVSVNGKKVSGSAQFILWGYLLHHGVIAVSTDVDLIRKLFPFSRVEVTNLERELGRRIRVEELAGRIATRIAQAFGEGLFEGKLTETEAEVARLLLEEKYLSNEWNCFWRNLYV